MKHSFLFLRETCTYGIFCSFVLFFSPSSTSDWCGWNSQVMKITNIRSKISWYWDTRMKEKKKCGLKTSYRFWRTLSAFLSAQKNSQTSKTTHKRALESKFPLLSAQKSAQTSGFAQKSAQLRSFTQKRSQMSGPLKKVLKREEEYSKERGGLNWVCALPRRSLWFD